MQKRCLKTQRSAILFSISFAAVVKTGKSTLTFHIRSFAIVVIRHFLTLMSDLMCRLEWSLLVVAIIYFLWSLLQFLHGSRPRAVNFPTCMSIYLDVFVELDISTTTFNLCTIRYHFLVKHPLCIYNIMFISYISFLCNGEASAFI